MPEDDDDATSDDDDATGSDDDDASGPDDDDASGPDDDDATGPDDDDATSDDDDDTASPVSLDADAIGQFHVADSAEQLAYTRFVAAVLSDVRLAPSAEEALLQQAFSGLSVPIVAPDATEPRVVEEPLEYEIAPVPANSVVMTDPAPLALADFGLLWHGSPTTSPEGERWQLIVDADAPFGGEWLGPPLLDEPVFEVSRRVAETVFVPQMLELEATIELCGGCAGELFMLGAKGLPAAAWPLDDAGAVSIDPLDFPSSFLDSGVASMILYRASRDALPLEDGRDLLLVSSRSLEFSVDVLPPGVGFVTAPGPVEYGSTEFGIALEGAVFPPGASVLVAGTLAGLEASTPTTGTAYVTAPLQELGVVDVQVTDPTGLLIARGAIEVVAPDLTCDFVETEENGLLSNADALVPGDTGCGLISSPNDGDVFMFSPVPNSIYTFETWAHRTGAPTNTFIELLNVESEVLTANDDLAFDTTDSRLVWTAPPAGEGTQFYLRVLAADGGSGADHTYVLTSSVFP